MQFSAILLVSFMCQTIWRYEINGDFLALVFLYYYSVKSQESKEVIEELLKFGWRY